MSPAIYEVTACSVNEGFTWVQKIPGGGLFAIHTLRTVRGVTKVQLSFLAKGPVVAIALTLFSSKSSRFVTTEARGLKEKCDGLASDRG